MVEGENFDCEEQRITHLDLRNDPQFPMVFVRESTDFVKDDLAIFPPINHENLYIDGFDKDRESPSESSSPSSSSRLSDSSSSTSDSEEQYQFCRKSHSQPSEVVGKSRWKSIIEIDIIQVWWKILLARVTPNFHNLVTFFSRNSLCSFSKTLRSFYPVMVIVIWWWMRNRTRRRDERIAQLLHQITQMNELLVKITHSN